LVEQALAATLNHSFGAGPSVVRRKARRDSKATPSSGQPPASRRLPLNSNVEAVDKPILEPQEGGSDRSESISV
jgi:hypothetical protein